MLVDRAIRLCGLPHLSCKRDQIKMRDYMDRRPGVPHLYINRPLDLLLLFFTVLVVFTVSLELLDFIFSLRKL